MSQINLNSRQSKTWTSYKYAILFMSPWIVGLVVFSIYPIFYSLYLAFTNFNLFDQAEFIGIENFVTLIGDRRYLTSLVVTGTFVGIGVPLQLAFALGLAMILYQGVYGLKYFRAIYYLPALLGGSVAIAMLWRLVFGSGGLLNGLLGALGLPESITNISWISNPDFALGTLIVLRVWQFGSPMLIFLAGLKQIPVEMYEAAYIDGVNPFSKFLYITMPMLSPIILFNLIMQIIFAFQSFTPAFIIGGPTGGAVDSLLLYTLYLFIIAFTFFQMGYASAIAWVLVILLGALTLLIFKLSKRIVYYEN